MKKISRLLVVLLVVTTIITGFVYAGPDSNPRPDSVVIEK